MEQILDLLKIDLGITHNKRDTYFIKLIETVVAELSRKGIDINYASIEDMMLVSDYSAWQYRKRQENIPLSNNLTQRIRDRIVKGRSESV